MSSGQIGASEERLCEVGIHTRARDQRVKEHAGHREGRVARENGIDLCILSRQELGYLRFVEVVPRGAHGRKIGAIPRRRGCERVVK